MIRGRKTDELSSRWDSRRHTLGIRRFRICVRLGRGSELGERLTCMEQRWGLSLRGPLWVLPPPPGISSVRRERLDDLQMTQGRVLGCLEYLGDLKPARL